MGDFSKELHEKVGEEVSKNNIDILICCGENAKYICEKAKEKMDIQNVYYMHDKDEIISILEKINRPGDVILLKASNGMKFYDLAERMINLWQR